MASVFKAAGQQEIHDQPWYLRYKGSILIIASGVAWVLGELAQSEEITELGWSGAVGIATTVLAFLINRFTRDGVTPSMIARLEQAGQRAFLDRPSISTQMVTEDMDDPDLPVYDGPSTNSSRPSMEE